MANPLYVLEYANLFCGSQPTDTSVSNHLTLRSVQLPRLEMQYVDHRPGGAPVSIEVDVIQTRMECKFELAGITPQVMKLMGRQSYQAFIGGMNDYWFYGHVRDYMTGAAIQAEAYVRGQLGSVEPSEFKRGGEPFGIKYAIRGIVGYYFRLEGDPVYAWNFFDNTWIVGGFDQSGNQQTLEQYLIEQGITP